MDSADIVIIGGGAAGMAAALGAADAGAADVLILERDAALGGILQQCIHNGFGLHRFKDELTGPEYAARDEEALRRSGVRISFDTTVLSFSPSLVVRATNASTGVFEIQAKAIVLAMGSRERTRGALGIAGTRPAGIYTAGTAQNLTNLRGLLPGREVVMMGSGDIGLIMARRLTYLGARVKAVYNRSSFSGGLKRNIVQCLDDYDIPLIFNRTVTSVHGRDRLSSVGVSHVDPATKRAIPGSEEQVACDTLLLAAGLIPENELAVRAGIDCDPKTGGARIDEEFRTSLPGVFSAGNVLHIHDLVDYVSEEGLAAGAHAASFVAQGSVAADVRATIVGGSGVAQVTPHTVSTSASEKFPLRFRVSTPVESATISVCADGEEIRRAKRRVCVPAEMETLVLDPALIGTATHIEVRVFGEEA